MTDKRFSIAFSGQIAPGADLAQVKANLAKLFKTDPAKIDPLFSGKRVVIRKDLDQLATQKYQMAMLKAGAIPEVLESGAEPPAAAPSAPSQAPTPKAPPPSAPADMGSVTLAEPGVTLVEPKETPAPQIDTGAMSMAEVGATLVEHRDVATPEFDLSGMVLDEPGVVLTKPKDVQAPDIDISDLSLSE